MKHETETEDSWKEEWPSLLEPEKLAEYMYRLERPDTTEEKEASRADRDTKSPDSTWIGESFEEILTGGDIDLSNVEGDSRKTYRSPEVLALPEDGHQRDYDALIPVEAESGVDLKEVQVKGCFHSRKNNPDRSSHIVIPYDTHQNNGDDYIYHIGTYSLDDQLTPEGEGPGLVPVNEAVLDHEEMDALLQYAKWLEPTGTSVNDSSKDRLRAQIKPQILMDYAEKVHAARAEHTDKSHLYQLAEQTYLQHANNRHLQQRHEENLEAFQVPETKPATPQTHPDQQKLSEIN